MCKMKLEGEVYECKDGHVLERGFALEELKDLEEEIGETITFL